MLEQADAILARGVSIEQFTADLAEYFRDLLFLRTGVTRDTLLGYAAADFEPTAVGPLDAAAAREGRRAAARLLPEHPLLAEPALRAGAGAEPPGPARRPRLCRGAARRHRGAALGHGSGRAPARPEPAAAVRALREAPAAPAAALLADAAPRAGADGGEASGATAASAPAAAEPRSRACPRPQAIASTRATSWRS